MHMKHILMNFHTQLLCFSHTQQCDRAFMCFNTCLKVYGNVDIDLYLVLLSQESSFAVLCS